ncbi:MAG: futalosine hydrolase [Phycisphaerales bacterium]
MPPAHKDHPGPDSFISTLLPTGGRLLLAVASEKEASAVLRAVDPHAHTPPAWSLAPVGNRADLVVTGVGKANAAGAVARTLDPSRHAGVMSVGICGSLPGGPPVGSVLIASASVFADEGVETMGAFLDCREMGFPLAPGGSDRFSPPPAWRSALHALGDHEGVIATVSTCSGTDALAERVASRSGAIAEAMEGAAVALAAARVDPSIPFAELRVVSNTTGDRERQRWELSGSLEALGRVLGRLLSSG